MNNWIRVVRTTALLVTLVAFSSKVHGAFSDAFDDLFTELAARADTLQGTTDKVEQKQLKAVNVVSALINKPATTLAADLKTAGTAIITLQKAFPSEFPGSAENSFGILSAGVLANIQSDIGNNLDAFTNAASSDLDGAKGRQIQAAETAVQSALTQASSATTFASTIKLLNSAISWITKGWTLIASPSPSPSAGSLGVSCKLNGKSFASYPAKLGVASYGGPDKVLNVLGASKGNTIWVQVRAFNVTGPGNYPLADNTSVVYDGLTDHSDLFANIISGSLHVSVLDVARQKVSGTFSFVASDDSGAQVKVAQGKFSASQIIPPPPAYGP